MAVANATGVMVSLLDICAYYIYIYIYIYTYVCIQYLSSVINNCKRTD